MTRAIICTRISLVAVALGLLAQPALAVPLPGPTAGFGISPARRNIVGVPPMTLTPTTVLNGTSSTYQVTVFPEILTQELSGAFDFPETPLNLNDSKIVLAVSPDQFVLGPGASQQVELRWNQLPIGHKWIAIGVVFQGVAQGQSGPVHVITRLLSVNFLSLPGLNRINGDFTGLYSEEIPPRDLRFVPRVENTGNKVWAPTDGRFQIQDSSGNPVYSVTWPGDVVVPGAQRDFPIDVHKILPAGNYTATVSMRFGGERTRSTAFTLVGPNQLPTPAIAIRGFNATGVEGSPAQVTARVASVGTARAGITLHLFLGRASDMPGAAALATGQVSYANLAPGRVVSVSHPLGHDLKKGVYRVIATWTDPTGAPHMLESEFRTTAGTSVWSQIWSVLGPILIVLLVLGLLLLIAALVRRMVDRQRQLEAELAAARAGRGVRPPVKPRVGVEEPVAAGEPVEEEPAAPASVAEEPVAREVVAEEPVAREVVAEEPAAPAAAEPEPPAPEPLRREPPPPEPLAPEPVTREPVAPEPVMREPVAPEPVTPAPPAPDSEAPSTEEPPPWLRPWEPFPWEREASATNDGDAEGPVSQPGERPAAPPPEMDPPPAPTGSERPVEPSDDAGPGPSSPQPWWVGVDLDTPRRRPRPKPTEAATGAAAPSESARTDPGAAREAATAEPNGGQTPETPADALRRVRKRLAGPRRRPPR